MRSVLTSLSGSRFLGKPNLRRLIGRVGILILSWLAAIWFCLSSHLAVAQNLFVSQFAGNNIYELTPSGSQGGRRTLGNLG